MSATSQQLRGRQTLQAPFENGNRRRDNLLFPSARGTEPLEFFTDSLLDNSMIPSPSPPKTAATFLRPRRAVGNTITRRVSGETTPKQADQRSGSSSSSTDTPHTHALLRPQPLQSSQRESRLPTRSGRSTPSPARGRQPFNYSFQSPMSDASSPPQGLTESYQRIDEEENLTAQESEIREDSDEDDSQQLPEDTFEQNSIATDRLRMERIRGSASPNGHSPSRIPRRPSSRLDLLAVAENKENIKHDDTMSSDASGLSFLEDVTNDSLRKKLHEHALDKQRLDRALKRESPAFNGRSSRHSGLTAENLQRRDDAFENGNQANGTPNGGVGERIGIPLNVPKSWGSNSRVSKDWLSKINDRKAQSSPSQRFQSASPASGTDWTAAAAAIPIPSVEDSPITGNFPSNGSTPIGNGWKNPSLEKVREWELSDVDFTGRSFQASNSPPIKVRNTALDDIRDREIEDLEKKAVTTSRLGEIHKRSSEELLRKRSPTPKIDQEPESVRNSSWNLKDEKQDEQLNGIDTTPSLGIESAESVPNMPGAELKSLQEVELANRRSHSSSNGSNVTIKVEDRRKESDPNDSQELLRRLSRATSASPAPAVNQDNWTVVDEEGNSQHLEPNKEEEDDQPKSDIVIQPEDATPAPTMDEKYSKTPVITGAWVDTPMPTARRRVPSSRDKSELRDVIFEGKDEDSGTHEGPQPQLPSTKVTQSKDDLLKLTRPSLPKSALESVIDGVKKSKTKESRDQTLPITEDTIESLEGFLAMSDEDMSTLLTRPEMVDDPSIAEDILDDFRDKSDRERDHLTQMAAYSRLISRLQLVRHSIHDAKTGISKLEHQVSTTGSGQHRSPHSAEHCADCECPSTGPVVLPTIVPTVSTLSATYVPLYIPTPRLWRRLPNHRLPRPSRLGWLTLTLCVWLIIESFMAHFYGNIYMNEYPFNPPPYEVGPDAPYFPYVTVTKLYHWSGAADVSSIVKPLWRLTYAVSVAFIRLFAQLTGWGDGFVADGPMLNAQPAHVPVSMDERIPRPDYGPDLSMMGDEYL